MKEASIQFDNTHDFMRFHVLFSRLHIHDADPICATWDVQIRIGSPEPCSVNPALDSWNKVNK